MRKSTMFHLVYDGVIPEAPLGHTGIRGTQGIFIVESLVPQSLQVSQGAHGLTLHACRLPHGCLEMLL